MAENFKYLQKYCWIPKVIVEELNFIIIFIVEIAQKICYESLAEKCMEEKKITIRVHVWETDKYSKYQDFVLFSLFLSLCVFSWNNKMSFFITIIWSLSAPFLRARLFLKPFWHQQQWSSLCLLLYYRFFSCLLHSACLIYLILPVSRKLISQSCLPHSVCSAFLSPTTNRSANLEKKNIFLEFDAH